MSRRPRFWLHRSSRFWGGLGMFAFLLSAWICSVAMAAEISYTFRNTPGYSSEASLWLMRGGAGFHWLDTKTEGCWFPGSNHWTGYSGWSLSEVDHAPRFSRVIIDDSAVFGDESRKAELFLPLWLPVIAWLGIWLLWIHRSDKKEEAFYETTTAPPPRE